MLRRSFPFDHEVGRERYAYTRLPSYLELHPEYHWCARKVNGGLSERDQRPGEKTHNARERGFIFIFHP